MIIYVGYLTCQLSSYSHKCQKSKMFKFHQFLDMFIWQIVCQIGELTQFISRTFRKLYDVCGKEKLSLNYQYTNNEQNQTHTVASVFFQKGDRK